MSVIFLISSTEKNKDFALQFHKASILQTDFQSRLGAHKQYASEDCSISLQHSASVTQLHWWPQLL